MSHASTTLINQVANWLMSQALHDTDLETVVMGCCERLHAAGIPLYRGYFVFSVLHPLYAAMGFTWNRGKGVAVQGYAHTPDSVTTQYNTSPHAYMRDRNLEYLRVRLDTERGVHFPVFDDLRQEGATDYLAFVASFSPGTRSGMLGSWATDQESGFTDEEIDALLRIQDRLAVACKMAVRAQLTKNVLGTYVGTNAGNRVLNGQIHRGDGEAIEAAIWYSDLRGSTMMADTLPSQDYIDALNAYFDATGGAVVEAGGEILSFIGDGLLAIFPAKQNTKGAMKSCGRAIEAARNSFKRMSDINAERTESGRDELAYGIALHRGEVMFGNVGVPERLTFSAFGSAVNEVVRLESLTSQLKEPLLVSSHFADATCEKSQWRPIGEFGLRGVQRDMSVFAPLNAEVPEEAAVAAQ